MRARFRADFPNNQIIYSIIGEQFYQYYQNNQWQINQRTHTQDYDLEDIETWDLRTIMEESSKYFLLSLENEEYFNIQIAGERIHVPVKAIYNIEHERSKDEEEIEFQIKWSHEQS